MGWEKVEKLDTRSHATPPARVALQRRSNASPTRLVICVRKDLANAISGGEGRRFDAYVDREDRVVRLVPDAGGQFVATRFSTQHFIFRLGHLPWLPDIVVPFISCTSSSVRVVDHDGGVPSIEVRLPLFDGEAARADHEDEKPTPPKPQAPAAKPPAPGPAKPKLPPAPVPQRTIPLTQTPSADLVAPVPPFVGHSGIEIDVASNSVDLDRQRATLTPRCVRMVAVLAAAKRGDILTRAMVARAIWRTPPSSYESLLSQYIPEANFALAKIGLEVKVVRSVGLTVDLV